MSKFGPKGPHKAPHGFKRFRPTPAELRTAVLAIPAGHAGHHGTALRRSAPWTSLRWTARR